MVDVGDEYESQERDSHWHVSRSVPLAFILTMIAFTLRRRELQRGLRAP